MSEPSEQDVEALADVLWPWGVKEARRDQARAVLTSDWLAERDAQQRREGAIAVRNALRGDTP